MVAAEVDLINVRLTVTEVQKASVLPVLLEGKEHSSFPPLLQRRVYSDFIGEEYYFVSLFDLVLTLYHIPFEDPLVGDLRAKLEKKPQTLTTKH